MIHYTMYISVTFMVLKCCLIGICDTYVPTSTLALNPSRWMIIPLEWHLTISYSKACKIFSHWIYYAIITYLVHCCIYLCLRGHIAVNYPGKMQNEPKAGVQSTKIWVWPLE